jgi:O-acetyl-ADP-ribose deacetylase (regulator of RNase III)
VFGYPLHSATRVALDVVRNWLAKKENRDQIDLIIFCGQRARFLF